MIYQESKKKRSNTAINNKGCQKIKKIIIIKSDNKHTPEYLVGTLYEPHDDEGQLLVEVVDLF